MAAPNNNGPEILSETAPGGLTFSMHALRPDWDTKSRASELFAMHGPAAGARATRPRRSSGSASIAATVAAKVKQ